MSLKLVGRQLRGDFGRKAEEILPKRTLNRRARSVNNALDPLEKRVLFTSYAFTPGDIAVETIGNGTTSLATTSSASVYVNEYSPTAQAQASPIVSLPIQNTSTGATGNQPLTEIVTNSGGYMTRSTNGQYLVIAGYDANANTSNPSSGGFTSTSTSTPSSIPRTIGVINSSGGVDTTTTFGGLAYNLSNVAVHGIVSNDGNEFWVEGSGSTGAVSPVQYIPARGPQNASGTALNTVPVASTGSGAATSIVGISIYNGQLYVSGDTSSGGLYGPGTVGSGEPTTGPQNVFGLPAVGGNPGGTDAFVFLNSTTFYAADIGYKADIGGIQKWTYSGGQWNIAYEAAVPPGSVPGGDQELNGLTMDANGVLYGTTNGTTSGYGANRLVRIVDTGSGFSFTTLATAPANEFFRGVALTPAGAGVSSITATPTTVTPGGTISVSANVNETGPSGTVTSVNIYQEATPGTQNVSGDTLVGTANLSSGTTTNGTWTLNSITTPGTGTSAIYYAVATDTVGYSSGIGSGTSPLAAATVALSNGAAPPTVSGLAIGSSGTVNYGSSVTIQAVGVTAASGDPIASVSFYQEKGASPSPSSDTLLGSVTTPDAGTTNYTLNYSPSGAHNLSIGTAYTIYAVATSVASVPSNPLQAISYGGLNVVAPSLSFQYSTYTVSPQAGVVTISVVRGGDLTDPAQVTYTTSSAGAGTNQFNAAAGTNYGSAGNTNQVTGVLNFPAYNSSIANSNVSNFNISILAVSGQSMPGIFTITLSSPLVTPAGGGTAIPAVLGTNGTTKVTISATSESFNLSSAAYYVNKSDPTDELTVSIYRTGYTGDAATINASTYALTSTVAAGLITNGLVANSSGGTDYTAITTPQAVTFNAGQSVATFSVQFNPSSPNSNVSFGVQIANPASLNVSGGGVVPGGSFVLGTMQKATGTIVNVPTTATYTGVPSTSTSIEVAGNYYTGFLPVVGDNTGAGSFGFFGYEMLEFSQALTPSIYPTLGTTISSISALTLSLYNSDSTAMDEYNGHPGNFNVYYIETPDATTATSSLTFSTTLANPTGFTLTTSTANLLGTFSFSDNAGYDTFTAVNSSGNTFATAVNAASGATTSLLNSLNSDSSFRIAITPADQGVGAIAADFDGLTSANPPTLTITAATAASSKTPEYISFNQSSYSVNESAGTATITLVRSSTLGGPPAALSDAATVYFNTSAGTATPGFNYTSVTGYQATFNASSAYATVTIPIADVTPQGGDKVVNLSLMNAAPGNSSGFAATVGTQSTAILTILDSQDAVTSNNFQTLTAVSDLSAEVQATGPYTTETFAPAGITSIAKYGTYGVADFNDGNGVGLGDISNTVTPAYPVTAINSITLEVFNLGGGTSGPIDVYLVPDTTSYLLPSQLFLNTAIASYPDPHFYNYDYYPEGLDTNPADANSFGIPMLLGSFNWSNSSPVNDVEIPLVNYNQATENYLINDLNHELKFRLVATPENSTVFANWGSSTAFSTDPQTGNETAEAPGVIFNVTEQSSTATTPWWLAPGSSASWTNTPGGTLTVTGAATIIGDPGSDEPNIVFTGSGDVLTIDPPTASQVHLGSLNISGGSIVNVVSPSSESDVLVIASTGTGLSIDPTSQLNLSTSDLIVQSGSLSSVSSEVGVGYNGGAENGLGGITASARQSDETLGVILNSTGSGVIYSTFDGVTVGAGDVLVKCTYFGDTNLDGKVDGSDYSRIDNGVLLHLTGWYNGDFNYDGVINGSDYTLIDNAYNTQGPVVAPQAEIATPAAQISNAVPMPPTATDSLFSKKKVKHTSIFDDLVIS